MKNNVFQSADYVPGVSGCRLDLEAGSIEINSANIAFGSLSSDPQMITVTAGEWSESDLPSNAVERYKFIGDRVMKIPAEYRDSAEFSTEDISFDRDGSDIRTTLTYRRLETEQEALVRTSLRSGSGVTINTDGLTITYNGKVVARLGCPKMYEPSVDQPFVVEGDQVFISQAFVDQFATKAQIVDEASTRASADEALVGRIGALEAGLCRGDACDDSLRSALNDWKPGAALLAGQYPTAIDRFAVTMAKNANGQYVCAGIGLGIDPSRGETKDGQTAMERAIEKGDAAEILRLLTSQITDSDLGLELRSKIEDQAEAVREVIREELRSGGLLHRR
ncbi:MULTISPECIES: hypothetical protein [Pseudomonas putida group]|uniref:hypothetical protein n=1 Tax=Pseudomonas putida group TaxID=136845 RepID=UPI00048DF572|nr:MULTISPECIES: hypothetical protein [Pseudomonas putida group]